MTHQCHNQLWQSLQEGCGKWGLESVRVWKVGLGDCGKAVRVWKVGLGVLEGSEGVESGAWSVGKL